MQYKDEKSLHLAKILGQAIEEQRKLKLVSKNKFANEYGLNDSNLGKVEKAQIDCKFVTFWRIAEALNLKPSELTKIVEDKLGEDFHLMDI